MSDGFYRAFEDRYRGTRDIIRARLAVYLPFVAPLAGAGAGALDLGCGRGEWLELLNEAGFAAAGVDLDEGMLAACRERGLDVLNSDALAALRARPDGSLAVVSAFHLVEHIPFGMVQDLIAEALRVLRPGGILIMETPNPENLVVGASSFYDDPSHLRPLPPKLLAFAVEFAGFGRHTVLRLQEAAHLRSDGELALFDVLAGVSPDYGVVAQKAGAAGDPAAPGDPFATHAGVDLHTLAQRYQQGQDALQAGLRQLRDAQTALGEAAQGQFSTVDAQVAHLHEASVALAGRLDRLEALAQHAASAGGRGEQSAAGLRLRVEALQQQHQGALDESARLAAHVAWIEGRLSHAETEAAALRQQLAELRRGIPGLRTARALAAGLRRMAAGGQLRQPARALLRRAVQAVLRRPALKRAARGLLARFPHLHTRILRLMYVAAPVDPASLPDADPLASDMSPRSLAIYRALLAAAKPKD